MNGLRTILIAMLVILAGYTAVVGANHGWNLLPVFFGDIVAMRWPGQFNLDFLFMLVLSACWVAWRHRFSPAGLALAALALFGGSMFLTIYLLLAARQARGDARILLLGESRVATSADSR